MKKKTKQRPQVIKLVKMNLPFGSGSNRVAYFAKIPDEEKIYVLKQWKSTYEQGPYARCWEQFNCHVTAIEYLKKFNTEAQTNIKCLPIKVVKIQELNNWYTLEEYIHGAYVKHNNNYSYVNTEAEKKDPVYQAIPHYVFEKSGGKEMLIDIQGVVYLITDPAVHSINLEKLIYGRSDLGIVGMKAFLNRHTCNDYCTKLGLSNKKG